MKLSNKINWVLAGLLVLAMLAMAAPIWASGNCNGPGDDNCYNEIVDVNLTGGDVIGGDISTGGNKSIALVAPGLGDVDIAQCLGSEAWTLLIGGKQKLVLNQVCMAEFYLKQGRYDLAAQSLCNQPEILNEYSTEADCEVAHDFTPVIPDHDVHARSDEFELAHAQQEEEIVYLQEEQASLVGRLDALTEMMEQAPAPAPTRVYVQQEPAPPMYSDEQFNAVWMALKGGDEDE